MSETKQTIDDVLGPKTFAENHPCATALTTTGLGTVMLHDLVNLAQPFFFTQSQSIAFWSLPLVTGLVLYKFFSNKSYARRQKIHPLEYHKEEVSYDPGHKSIHKKIVDNVARFKWIAPSTMVLKSTLMLAEDVQINPQKYLDKLEENGWGLDEAWKPLLLGGSLALLYSRVLIDMGYTLFTGAMEKFTQIRKPKERSAYLKSLPDKIQKEVHAMELSILHTIDKQPEVGASWLLHELRHGGKTDTYRPKYLWAPLEYEVIKTLTEGAYLYKDSLDMAHLALRAHRSNNLGYASKLWWNVAYNNPDNEALQLISAEGLSLAGDHENSDKLYSRFFDHLEEQPDLPQKTHYIGSHKVSTFDYGEVIGRSIIRRESDDKTSLENQMALLEAHRRATNTETFHTMEVIELREKDDTHLLYIKQAEGNTIQEEIQATGSRRPLHTTANYLASELANIWTGVVKTKRPSVIQQFEENLPGSVLDNYADAILEILPDLIYDHEKYRDVISRDGHTENYIITIDDHTWAIDIEDRGLAKPQREAAKLTIRGHNYDFTKEQRIWERDLTKQLILPYNKHRKEKELQPKVFHEAVIRESFVGAISLMLSESQENRDTAKVWLKDTANLMQWSRDRYQKHIPRAIYKSIGQAAVLAITIGYS